MHVSRYTSSPTVATPQGLQVLAATYLVGIQALLQVLKLCHLVRCDNLTVQATHTKVRNQCWSKHILIQPSGHLLCAAIKQKHTECNSGISQQY